MNKVLVIFLSFIFSVSALAQESESEKIVLFYTTKAEREKFKIKLLKNKIYKYY